MNGDILDPEGARERLNAWKGRIDRLAADTQAMSDRLQGVRVTETDSTGLAEVTVDSTGALVDLRLTERMQRVAPAVVAQTILATLAAARKKLADRSEEIIAETMGSASPVARAITENVGRQLRGGAASERSTSSGDDDGFDSLSYLERR